MKYCYELDAKKATLITDLTWNNMVENSNPNTNYIKLKIAALQFKRNTATISPYCLNWLCRTLEFAEGFDWILNLLLRTFTHFGPNLFRLLRTYEWLLFWSFHLPNDDWWLKEKRFIKITIGERTLRLIAVICWNKGRAITCDQNVSYIRERTHGAKIKHFKNYS